jgi:hypothetical protein
VPDPCQMILQDFLDAGGSQGNFRVIKTETKQPASGHADAQLSVMERQLLNREVKIA